MQPCFCLDGAAFPISGFVLRVGKPQTSCRSRRAWTTDEKTSFDILDACFEAGLNTVDSADVYSAWVREVLAANPKP
jgi:aryl-alcohol dehydrogenase-like predicted oxidoreductase